MRNSRSNVYFVDIVHVATKKYLFKDVDIVKATNNFGIDFQNAHFPVYFLLNMFIRHSGRNTNTEYKKVQYHQKNRQNNIVNGQKKRKIWSKVSILW